MGIVGIIIVFACVFGGYIAAGGHIHVIWQPFEVLIIGGAAVGGLIIGNSMSTLKHLGHMIPKAIMGKGVGKTEYLECLELLYQLFQLMRKQGPQSIEKHVEEPENSDLFKMYPKFLKNHHAVHFLCDTLKIIISSDLSKYDIDDLLDQDIKCMHEEEHKAQAALQSTADGLPGLGIVAAVLGIVHTMDYLDQGAAKIGALVAAALVGTFLGVLMCYGFIAPIANKIAANIDEEGRFLLVIKAALVMLQSGAAPIVCVEFARRTIYPVDRPTFDELDKATKTTAQAA